MSTYEMDEPETPEETAEIEARQAAATARLICWRLGITDGFAA